LVLYADPRRSFPTCAEDFFRRADELSGQRVHVLCVSIGCAAAKLLPSRVLAGRNVYMLVPFFGPATPATPRIPLLSLLSQVVATAPQVCRLLSLRYTPSERVLRYPVPLPWCAGADAGAKLTSNTVAWGEHCKEKQRQPRTSTPQSLLRAVCGVGVRASLEGAGLDDARVRVLIATEDQFANNVKSIAVCTHLDNCALFALQGSQHGIYIEQPSLVERATDDAAEFLAQNRSPFRST